MLRHFINCHNLENGSDTPDYILAGFLDRVLTSFDNAVNERRQWWHQPAKPGDSLTDAPPVRDPQQDRADDLANYGTSAAFGAMHDAGFALHDPLASGPDSLVTKAAERVRQKTSDLLGRDTTKATSDMADSIGYALAADRAAPEKMVHGGEQHMRQWLERRGIAGSGEFVEKLIQLARQIDSQHRDYDRLYERFTRSTERFAEQEKHARSLADTVAQQSKLIGDLRGTIGAMKRDREQLAESHLAVEKGADVTAAYAVYLETVLDAHDVDYIGRNDD